MNEQILRIEDQDPERGTRTHPLLFAEGEKPPLGPEHYDHVHIGDRCRKNRWPECGYNPAEGGDEPEVPSAGQASAPAEVESPSAPSLCTACQLAKMLESGVLSSSVEAGHSSCEGTRAAPCSCGCEYSRMHQCKECLRKGTTLDDRGQCVDRRSCANAIVAGIASLTAERKERLAVTPAPRTKSASAPRPCHCGCGETTGGGMYRPGHDARHVSRLASQVKQNEITAATALEAVSHSAKLQDKLQKAIGS